jgi:hypothetical protein
MAMPARFEGGVFEPELAKLMTSAFEGAWAKVLVSPADSAAASHHLAEAIVEMVRAGSRDREQLVASALVSLASAKGISGEWMIRPQPRN